MSLWKRPKLMPDDHTNGIHCLETSREQMIFIPKPNCRLVVESKTWILTFFNFRMIRNLFSSGKLQLVLYYPTYYKQLRMVSVTAKYVSILLQSTSYYFDRYFTPIDNNILNNMCGHNLLLFQSWCERNCSYGVYIEKNQVQSTSYYFDRYFTPIDNKILNNMCGHNLILF